MVVLRHRTLEARLHQTKVTWALSEVETGVTRLHVAQSGFASEAKPEIGDAKYGWMAMLEQVRKLLASG